MRGRSGWAGGMWLGLVLCAEMYGAPYDLLAAGLGVREDRCRGIVACWRHAGYAQTGRLGPGPAWCWLTRPGLAVTGLHYTPTRSCARRMPCSRSATWPCTAARSRNPPSSPPAS